MVQHIAFSFVGSSSSQTFRKEDITISVLDCAENRVNSEDPFQREQYLQCKQNKTVSLLFNLTESVCEKKTKELRFIKEYCNKA